MILDSSCDY